MKIWHQYPFIRLLIPFIGGIIIATSISFEVHIPIVIIGLVLLIYVTGALFFFRKLSYNFRWIPGALINLIFLMLGYELTLIGTPEFQPSNISHYSTGHQNYIVQVKEPADEKPNSYKVIAKVLYAVDSGVAQKLSGKVIFYFQKDSAASRIEYGDQLIIHVRLNKISPPQNPGEFNYKRFMANKGIYEQGYVKSSDWKVVARDKGFFLTAFGLHLRRKLMDILSRQNIKGREYAIANAILLGYDGYLEPEQMREFSGSGAMHILCVSGLHVGIIYLLLNAILFFMNKKRWTRILKTLLLIILIWFYALLTGFAPAVIRAATMFTIVIIGDASRRNANIYNSLAASALILLALNPRILMDVGFQLSYIAVAGIVWLYRPLYNTVIPKNFLLRKIWQITVVSIAATLATLPVTLFYFRQFPVLFPVTNLIVIPLATGIIYTGISVLLFSSIPVLGSALSFVLVKMIAFLNASVKFIEGLSFGVIRGIYIDSAEMILIGSCIIFFCVFLLNRKRRFFFITAGSALLLFISVSVRHFKNLQQRRMVVYNINKASAIDFINGRQSYLFADSVLINDQQSFGYHIQNAHVKAGIKNTGITFSIYQDFNGESLIKQGRYFQYYDKRIVLIDDTFHSSSADKTLKVDCVILSHNPSISLSSIRELFDFDLLILDSSNYSWETEEWITECKNEGINYYSVQQQGALVLKI